MLFQIQTDMDTAITAVQDSLAIVEEPMQESINLFAMAQYGGWIMIVLALLMAFAIYLFVERLVVLTKATKEDKTFMNRIRDYIKEGKIDDAREIQYAVNEIIYAMCACKCNMYAAAKEVLRLQGIDIGDARKPLAQLKEESKPLAAKVNDMITEAKAKFC